MSGPLQALIRATCLAIALVTITAAGADAGHGLPGPSMALVQPDHVARLLTTFEDRLREIPRTRPVLLYAVLADGFAGWAARGHPVVRESLAPPK